MSASLRIPALAFVDAKIARWRREQAHLRTDARRPDLRIAPAKAKSD